MLCWKRDTAAAVSAEAAADARKTAAAVLVLPRGRPHGQRCCHAHAPKSRAVSSNSVDFKGQNQSHRQRHSSSTHYIQQIYHTQKIVQTEKSFIFHSELNNHLQREIVETAAVLEIDWVSHLDQGKDLRFEVVSKHYICLPRYFFLGLLCLDFFKARSYLVLF